MQNDIKLKTNLLVLTGVLTALTTIATMFLKIPVGLGYIHLGDGIIFFAALILPKKYSVFIGGIGTALADIFSGYAVWAPFSIVICGVSAFVIGILAQKGAALTSEPSGSSPKFGQFQILGLILASLIIIAGYFVAEIIIFGNKAAPLLGAGVNCIQVFAGIIIAFCLYKYLPYKRFL